MDRAEFLAEWNEMSFEERAGFVRLVIEEECIDRRIPIPEINVSPEGHIASVQDPVTKQWHDEIVLGETFVGDRVINIYGGSLDRHGEPLFNDPWESVATAFHETSHWFRSNEQNATEAYYKNEDLSESYAQVATRDFQWALDNLNQPAEVNPWSLPTHPQP